MTATTAPPTAAGLEALVLERTFDAPKDRVWDAWTRVEALKAWFGPGTMTIPEAAADVRVDGEFRITMAEADGAGTHTVFGTYQEVTPTDRLVFSWAWEGGEIGNTMRITVELAAAGDQTRLTLTQEQFATEAQRDGHLKGWSAAMPNLERYLAS